MQETKTKGGKQSRIGVRFFKAIESIKDFRLTNGKSKERMSTEKITNMIIRHKYWLEISQDIINSSEEDMNKYGA